MRYSVEVLVIQYALVLLCLLGLKLELSNAQLLGGLFSKCSRRESGCILGLFGYTMHQWKDGSCSETCALLPRLKRGWDCGYCIDDSNGGNSTKAPVRSPVIAPVNTPVNTPVNAPVNTPVNSPANTPVNAPASLPVRPPLGQYIQSGYSERIILPQPQVPNLLSSRSNCPHLQSGLLDWHSSTTWPNGIVPLSGVVTIPSNTKVVINKTIAALLDVITIPTTSSLIFGENAEGIELMTRGMDVKGSLIAGSSTCRIQTPITITLSGVRPTNLAQNRPIDTYKGISVTGTLSLHGKRYFRTWTRLAKSALVGGTELILQDAVNWEPGQEVVLVTTAMKDSREWHQNEVCTIASVSTPSPKSGVGTSVYLTKPIQYSHIANAGYQAEVGLLSRAIVIQGSAADSEPIDKDPLNCALSPYANQLWDRYGDTRAPCEYTEITGFGGHVIVFGAGRGYVSGVEFYRMGQTNVLGRYPIHFHLLGNCPDCYVTDSAFYRSYYRCVSIHGTNNATVSENVAYDVTGYCYYLEDGVEENNTLSFNLAAHIHKIGPDPPGKSYGQTLQDYKEGPNLTLPADVTASGFYITNVHNNIIGNAASGVRIYIPIVHGKHFDHIKKDTNSFIYF
jgi:G8 domain